MTLTGNSFIENTVFMCLLGVGVTLLSLIKESNAPHLPEIFIFTLTLDYIDSNATNIRWVGWGGDKTIQIGGGGGVLMYS